MMTTNFMLLGCNSDKVWWKSKGGNSGGGIDIPNSFTKSGDTFKSLKFTCVSLTARDGIPYKGKIQSLRLEDVAISESGRRWMVDSGFLASPHLSRIELIDLGSEIATFMFSNIRLPNLHTLVVTHVEFNNDESARALVSLFERSPSICNLVFENSFSKHAEFIVSHFKTMPALTYISVADSDDVRDFTLSYHVVKWMLSNENTSVHTVVARLCPAMREISPTKFFLHPCFRILVQDLRSSDVSIIRTLDAMYEAKKRTVHFMHIVRNNEALARLHVELARMVFDMYEQWLHQ